MRFRVRPVVALALFVLFAAGPALAQGLTLPPSGDNQRAKVVQHIGPVKVSVDYSSPRVVLKGTDRRGMIWGKLVPYGLSDLGFNNCTSCPWRAGANMNTVFSTSNDVKIEGQSLPAGSYGLHMIPGETEWTVIFSKDTSSWGSFSYDPKLDALRVTVKPEKSPYHEWLTFEFTDREPEKAVVALKWEELAVPITITVPGAKEIYVEILRKELRSDLGFYPSNWRMAADYCIQNKVDLPEALAWARKAVTDPNVGEQNFQNLTTLWRAELANGLDADAAKTLDKALASPTATPILIHYLGRQLLGEGKKAEAMKIFQTNAKRFPNQWPVNVGLMRAYAAMGDKKKALEYAKLAAPQAPDPLNKKNLENMVKLLEEGKDIPQ
ncbi:MAG TPA: DUF2911 domain-containing protein [Thermoanaerobaculia bacterium]|nr:DUF2911 domain-containing protein [Thermoanaerobaculia bacterium]